MNGRRVVAASLAVVLGGGVVLGALSPFLLDDGPSAAPRVTTVSAPARRTVALPDVVVSDLQGRPVALRSFIGQPLVVNFWYATCPPCIEEMPALGEVAAEYAGRVRVVGINPQDDATTASAVAAERRAGYEHLLDRTRRAVDAFELTGFPSTVLVGADGRVQQVVRQALTADEFRQLFEGLLR